MWWTASPCDTCAVRAGRLDDVVAYCKAHVERVREIHRRLTFANTHMLLAPQAG